MKNLKYLLFVIPFLFIGSVKAETIEFDYSNSYYSYYGNQGFTYVDLKKFYSDYSDQSSIVIELSRLLQDYYNENYQKEYPYYFISMIIWCSTGEDFVVSSNLKDFNINATLFPLSSIPSYSDIYSITSGSGDFFGINASYNFSSGTFTMPFVSDIGSVLSATGDKDIFTTNAANKGSPINIYNPTTYYDSNFDLVFNLEDTYIVKSNGSSLFTFNNGDVISNYINSSGIYNNYLDVNLNDYAYVALSLKDYNQDQFDLTFQMKGQFCSTPVYNYGMTTKDSIIGNKVTDRCSPYYDNFTPVRFSVLDKDLKNNSIYYLKAYDKSKENIVKIDTSIFDIHYITEEEANNPILTINGKKYSAIPYSDLPSTATKNEEENYTPGASEKFSFSDIFTTPLDFLKNIWDSIVNVFTIINQFILLLPETLQYFFYISFTLAIVLGIIKIIL